ncbi:MAG: Clp protease N-terminal domain-containing protein [Gaiellaceae bacterium]
MMTLNEELLSEAKTVRERLLDLQHEVDVARVDYQHVIRRLHAAGGSMREIAESLGLSHQRVHQIVDAGPEDARGGRRGFAHGQRPFRAPFTRQARVALAAADDEAAALGHGYLGTEHLLLGLFRAERGGAAAALAQLGLDQEAVRAQVVAKSEGEPRPPKGRAPFTAEAKKVLEHAVSSGVGGRQRRIGTEQLLVSLATVPGGSAHEILTGAGADEAKVREALESARGR